LRERGAPLAPEAQNPRSFDGLGQRRRSFVLSAHRQASLRRQYGRYAVNSGRKMAPRPAFLRIAGEMVYSTSGRCHCQETA